VKYTSNYNLKKPDAEDFYNIDDFNENMDLIDEAIVNHTHSNYLTIESGLQKIQSKMKASKVYKVFEFNASEGFGSISFIVNDSSMGQFGIGWWMINFGANTDGNYRFEALLMGGTVSTGTKTNFRLYKNNNIYTLYAITGDGYNYQSIYPLYLAGNFTLDKLTFTYISDEWTEPATGSKVYDTGSDGANILKHNSQIVVAAAVEDQPIIRCANKSYKATDTLGTSALSLRFADHGAKTLEVEKYTHNTSRTNIYCEQGYNTAVKCADFSYTGANIYYGGLRKFSVGATNASIVGNTAGSGNIAFFDFCDANGNRQGYVGKAVAADNNIYVVSELANGGITLAGSGTGNITLQVGSSGKAVFKNLTGTYDIWHAGNLKAATDNNTIFGNNATISNTSATNEIVIGAGASGKGSNTAHIGNSSVTSISYGPGTGTMFTNRSDRRLKEDIQEADLSICYDAVKKLQLRRFRYKDFVGNERDIHLTGFIADEFEKVFPKAVIKKDQKFPILDENGDPVVDEDGKPKMEEIKDCASIDMSQVVPTLLGAVQKLMEKVETLEAEIAALKT